MFPHPNTVHTSILPRHPTCPSHLIIYSMTLILFDKECSPRSSSLCSLHQYTVSSFVLGPNILLSTLLSGDRGSSVVKVLCYKSEGRWFDPRFSIDIKSFRSHYGTGVDSASNRNEYQEHFLRVKAAGA